MLRGRWSVRMEAVIILVLCVREDYLKDGIKSLPLSSLDALSTKELYCSREKERQCVYTYVPTYDLIT